MSNPKCWIMLAATVATMLLAGPARSANEAAEPLKIIAGPYQMNVTQQGTTIMWETNKPASSVVECGDEAPPELRYEGLGDSRIHEVVIGDLPAESTFFYRVVSEAGDELATSDVYTFITAVKQATPFAFVVVGDSRTYPDRWGRIAGLCYAERPNFALHVGDVVTDGRVYEQWQTEWLTPAAELMSRVPMYVSIGNHEENAEWFNYYVSYPPPENYYSFDYGNAHFVCVDTNHPFSVDSRQYQWIEQDLRDSKATWKFAFHHHPLYSSDSDDYGDTSRTRSTHGDLRIRPLAALYEKYDVDIVFVGHIHTYERTWPLREGQLDPKDGVVYLQIGGGGAELEEFAPQRSDFTAKVARNHHYASVAIAGRNLRMMAYDMEGRMFDYLDLRKE